MPVVLHAWLQCVVSTVRRPAASLHHSSSSAENVLKVYTKGNSCFFIVFLSSLSLKTTQLVFFTGTSSTFPSSCCDTYSASASLLQSISLYITSAQSFINSGTKLDSISDKFKVPETLPLARGTVRVTLPWRYS